MSINKNNRIAESNKVINISLVDMPKCLIFLSDVQNGTGAGCWANPQHLQYLIYYVCYVIREILAIMSILYLRMIYFCVLSNLVFPADLIIYGIVLI